MRIHWFSFTVHASESFGRDLWQKFFFHSLGDLVDSNRKGRGFENIDVALNEAKFYYNPIQSKTKEDVEVKEYFHFEFTGQSCDAIAPEYFSKLFEFLSASGHRFAIKRIDLAFDNVPFTPIEFCKAIVNQFCTTLAKRESLSLIQAPYAPREDGQLGCDTCYIGDKSSMRFIRVYNLRGFTRLEMVCRDERAHIVAEDIFKYEYSRWDEVARGHVVQYIRFDERFGQWVSFVGSAVSANIKISSARVVSLSRMEAWFERQVSVALSVYVEVWGEYEANRRLKSIIRKALSRDRSRYSAVLQLANAGGML